MKPKKRSGTLRGRKPVASVVQPLLPTGGRRGVPRLAGGVRAGRWVFVSGAMALDRHGALAPEVGKNPRPLSGLPRWHTEASLMYRRAAEVLEAGGSAYANALRTDQFFPDWRAVPFLHQVRREACGAYVPPSTSILEPALSVRGAAMSMEVIAAVPGTGLDPQPIFPPELEVPAGSSFAPVVVAGDYVFVAGFLAAWKPGDLGGIAPEARVPEGHLWKGNRIQLEADYIVRRKLLPALKAAGSSLEHVVKAQVYLADIHDVPAFNLVWARHFGARIPATTFVPTSNPGFAIADARCEINLLAVRADGATRLDSLPGHPAVCDGHPLAVRAGELVCLSGMVAADEHGCIASRRGSGRATARRFVEAQMVYLLDAAETACRRLGSALDNVVRVQQFHTNLAEFEPSLAVWGRRLGGRALPISALQVPGPLLVPGCTVQLDLWIYAP